ncbi:MAG: flagellar basal body-associated FliL family protein, partial [Aeromonadaceae bacterium]|nr:flagellar basal body-associated FliL family protein [Aeromonadaceae bacterium]
ALLKVVTTYSADELLTSAGKERLRAEALKTMQGVMTEVSNEPVIEQLLFTGFVMQ